MKVIKKYKLVEIGNTEIDGIKYLDLEELPNNSFFLYDSEEEAIEAAYKFNKYREFAIIPIISFDNF